MAQRSRRGNGLDHGVLPDLIGYQLRLAQIAVFRDFERTVGDLGISPGRFGVLVLVDANPGITQSRLAEAVGLDRSTLVPVLDDSSGANCWSGAKGRTGVPTGCGSPEGQAVPGAGQAPASRRTRNACSRACRQGSAISWCRCLPGSG